MSTAKMSRYSEGTEIQQDAFKNMWMDIYGIFIDRLPTKKTNQKPKLFECAVNLPTTTYFWPFPHTPNSSHCVIEIPVRYWYLPLCSSLTTLQGGVWRQTAGSQQNLSCLDVIHVSVMCKNLTGNCVTVGNETLSFFNKDALWDLSPALQICHHEKLILHPTWYK